MGLTAPSIVAITCASIITTCSVQLGTGFLSRLRHNKLTSRTTHENGNGHSWNSNGAGYERIPELYKDEDGIATAESMRQYHVRTQKIAVLLGSLLGFGVAVAAATLVTTEGAGVGVMVGAWMFVVSWAWFLMISAGLMLEHEPKEVFQIARWIVFLAFVLTNAEVLNAVWETSTFSSQVRWGFRAGKAVALVTIWTAGLWIPRRPTVYRDGKLVDGMRTAGLLSHYTFYWVGVMLSKAIEKGHLDEVDIPAMDRGRRAEYLLERFEEVKQSPQLWMTVFRTHWSEFVKNWIGTVVMATLLYLPPLIMNKILATIENRGISGEIGYEGYYWVLLLGFTQFLEAAMMSYVYMHGISYIMLPIRSQLSALVFSKTMKKKDVKGSQKADKETEEVNGASPQKPKEDGEDKDELQDLKQGTINLISVDAERISLFATYINILVEAVVGSLYGFGWIYLLLGWQAMLAALAVIFTTTPMNYYFSKRYTRAQDELMKLRDKKMGVVSEALQGIRQIKFSALEERWEQKIRDVRNEELKTLRKVYIADVAIVSAWIINPNFLAAAALSVHAIINGSLLPSLAFPALAIFNELEFTLSIVPEMIADGIDAFVSINRIQKYLDSASMEKSIKDSERIAMTNATIAWAANESEEVQDRFCLRGINLEFPRGELSVVSGRTGSGKSLLLGALLGEADLLSGTIELPAAPPPSERGNETANPGNWILPSAVAYVAQIPWIENASLRDNILFGLPFIRDRYEKVLHACALEKDLESLADGEMTEIGADGINLSGGQRWRVSFARAVYSRAGIVILDDVFSAVDAHVGKHLFENALTGELMNNRTRILVTHHLRLSFSKAKYAVFLGGGRIENVGMVAELQERGVLESIIAVVEDGAQEAEEQIREEEAELMRVETRESVISSGGGRRPSVVEADIHAEVQKPRQFTQDEERERGAVSMSIYKVYMKASGGYWKWFIVLTLFAAQQALVLGKSFWVKLWTASYESRTDSPHSAILGFSHQSFQKVMNRVIDADTHNLRYWIGLYALMNAITVFSGCYRYWYVYLRSLHASRVLFDDLVRVVLRAPLRWLDTVPTGRILNRFSKDFETVDSKLASDVGYLLWNSLQLIAINIVAIYISPVLAALAVLGLVINGYYAYLYLAGAREMKRLESNSRSPMFELFGAALSGVATIRAFGRNQAYVDKMFSRIDTYTQRSFYVWIFNRWVSVRMSIVGTVFVMMIGLLIVAIPSMDASLAGFTLAFVLNYTANVFWSLRRYANVELDMNSMERISDYTNIETENQGGVEPPAAWPTEGRIEVDNLHIAYAPGLPVVLKGVTFEVKPRERIGVVGRTGAGKSSLTLALFQFIRATKGTIRIDNLDISTLSLSSLRSRLAIIPQDPVLFSGTIRSNLDPFSQHPSSALLEALRRVHLIPPSSTPDPSNIFSTLSSKISEGGLNLSQGQRQLLCLARAIVSRPKILVMDEATSAVDLETDKMIQKTIREEFVDATTVVIAHRLASVMDYERILVLGEGEVVEFGSPGELLDRKGVFWGMVRETGEGEVLEGMVKGRGGEENSDSK